MRNDSKFTAICVERQKAILNAYFIDYESTNLDDIYVDTLDRPYLVENGQRNNCFRLNKANLICGGFHNHYAKN